MRLSMWFKGVPNDSVGALLMNAPICQMTAMRGEKQVISGRDGFLLTPTGCQEITIKQDICVRRRRHLDAVRQWLTGRGDLIYTGDGHGSVYDAYAYDAAIITTIPVTRLYRHLEGWKFAVTFTCQPFRHQAQESAITLTASGRIACHGIFDALPLVKVEGSGTQTLTINGRSMTLRLTSGIPLYLDCDAGVAYTEANGIKVFAGDSVIVMDDWYVLNAYKPELQPNPCEVAFTSGIARVTIQPRWRWA